MKRAEIYLTVVVLILLCSIIIWGLYDNRIKDNYDNLPPSNINPTDFSVGAIPMKEYKSSNNCNDKVLYPVKAIYVDYGQEKASCPCNQFIQPI